MRMGSTYTERVAKRHERGGTTERCSNGLMGQRRMTICNTSNVCRRSKIYNIDNRMQHRVIRSWLGSEG